MSDPQTKPPIEDVLSSVRRLVSTAKTDVKPAPGPETDVVPAPGRLLLTPALRVAGPDEVLTEQVVGPQTSPTTVPENFRSTRASLEATIAELEAAVLAQPDEWELDGSEVKTVPTWETVSYPPLDEVEDAEAIEETSPADMRGEAALEALLTGGPLLRDEAEFDEDAPVDDDAGIAGLTFLRTQPIPELVPAPQPEPAPAPALDSVPDPLPDDADVDYGDDLAPDGAAVAPEDDLDAFLSADGVTIDENALRVLVMDIVREELQGKLGERITRNVRKMVRREVNRALDMHGFD